MRRFLALALAFAIVSLGVPTTAFAAAPQAKVVNGQVAGTARSAAGTPIANTTVRLRNTGNGEVVVTSKTTASGEYTFKGDPAGNYVVELVDNNGVVIATSMPVSLATGSMSVTGVALTTAAGKAGIGAVGAMGPGPFFHSTGGLLLLAAAAGGGVVGILGATKTASASR